MSLTLGRAPFSGKPKGRFNFDRQGPEAVLLWEPTPKRVRALVSDEIVADSTRVMVLHESGLHPVYYFPREDVRAELLEPSDTVTTCPWKGQARYWHVRVGERLVADALWEYPEPLEHAPPLTGYLAPWWDRVDTWLEEDEEVFDHPRNPYTRIDILPSSRLVTVRDGETVLAQSTRALLLVETGMPARWYVPFEDVRTDLLEPSETRSSCPYKGTAWYWRRPGGDDVAWAYLRPPRECAPIAGHAAFYDDRVRVEADER